MFALKKTLGIGLVMIGGLSIFGCNQQGDVIAKVGDRKITAPEFAAYRHFKRIPDNDQKRGDALLNDYLQREALAQAITETGSLDKAQIDAELDEFRQQMLISRYFESFLDKAVTESAIQNFYAANADRYEEKRVHVAHILIRTRPEMTDAELKAKLTQAHEIASLANSGKDFSELAAQYSEDELSAKKGGDLGWMKAGAIDASFSKEAFELAVGKTSEPVKTPYGFHVLKVLEAPTVVKQPFDAVKGDIRYELRSQAKEAELKRLQGLVKVERKG